MGGSTREVLRALVLVVAAATSVCSLNITRLSVPNFVRNGSEETVQLDCEYTYNITSDKKLVVKWFHDDDPNPVYQWIPEINSKIYSEKFRLDADYMVPTGDNYTWSRAISIMRPTTELTGTYKCEVQSLEGYDNKQDSMTVYSLPTSVDLNYTINEGKVRVVCEVEGIYPLPEMALFQVPPQTVDRLPINDTHLVPIMRDDGSYDIKLYSDIPVEELPSLDEGPTSFWCTVLLDGAEYMSETSVPYFPKPIAEKMEGGDSDGSSTNIAFTLLVLLSSALQFFLT